MGVDRVLNNDRRRKGRRIHKLDQGSLHTE